MSSLRASKGTLQIAYGTVGSHARVDAAGKPRRDLLEQPTVSVRILKRSKRGIRTTLRIAPSGARVFHRVVEWSSSEVENLTHVEAACDQRGAGRIDVVHG